MNEEYCFKSLYTWALVIVSNMPESKATTKVKNMRTLVPESKDLVRWTGGMNLVLQ